MAFESGKAFEEVVPPFASSSNTGIKRKRAPWDVFINHRGPDSKHTLAASIYQTLKPMGLQVFLDEPELQLGDPIPSEIQDAMATSFLHIAILSPNYAESPWCLAELSYILNTDNTVIPVFYNVKIADIRWGKGIYTDALIKHEASGRYSSEKLQDWRRALQQATYLKGHVVKENVNEGEAELLKAIESYVKKHFEKIPLVVADHPIGLDEIVEDFQSYAFDSSQDVRIVGIVGMGGCGKTTLAKQYYNKTRYSIYKCSFISNVKDVAKKDLHKLQSNMLQDLGFDAAGKKVKEVKDVERGKSIVANYLTSIQVFIVLDDIDHQDQLEYLVPIKQSLGYGSIIIVTSRDSGILTSWGISYIYKMKSLDPKYAMNLFCYHAFPRASLIDEFESRVHKFLEVCQGLPLSLKVLGGLVRGKSQDYWDDQLKVVSRLLPKDIKSILKVSFDSLEEEEKEIYLDICSFFIGEEKQLAVTVWDGSGWNGLYSFSVLENKCLVEVDEKNLITMHDHLRDLGKEIAYRKQITKSPYRLWSPQQINDIEVEGQESVLTRGVRGIVADTRDSSKVCTKLLECVRNSGRRFERRRLEILTVKNNRFTEELAELSAGLVWLRWVVFPHRVLPPWLSLDKLRILEIQKAENLEEVWSETAEPPVQLRELHITFRNICVIRFPRSIGRLEHLKKISIRFQFVGSGIDSLPEEFCLLRSLEYLRMSHSQSLEWLPDRFGDLTSLRHLDLRASPKLMMLPASFKQLINLQYIDFSGCSKLSFPPDIFGNMRMLETLAIERCCQFNEFPQLVASHGALKKLDFGGMEIPDSIGQLRKLEELKISSSSLTALPASIGNLSSLSLLSIYGCHKLESLSETLGQLTNLQSLYIIRCHSLTELTILSGCFSSSLCSLKSISLCSLSLVRRISISQQCCPSLEYLSLLDIKQLEEIDSLPKSVKSVEVEICPNLKRIGPNIAIIGSEDGLDEPPNFAESVSLQEFVIKRCDQQMKKIQGLENCRSLKTLIAHTRWEEPGIQSLENIESLRRVEMSAWNISALQPCLESIKNKSWPDKCVICARTAPGVENVVKSLTFPGLTLFDYTETTKHIMMSKKTSTMVLRRGQRRSSDGAIMLCFVINPSSNNTRLYFQDEYECFYIESGKWVWIGVFALIEDKDEFTLQNFCYDEDEDDDEVEDVEVQADKDGEMVDFEEERTVHDEDDKDEGMVEDEDEGMVYKEVGVGWVGDKKRVIEAFYQLLQHLQNMTLP